MVLVEINMDAVNERRPFWSSFFIMNFCVSWIVSV